MVNWKITLTKRLIAVPQLTLKGLYFRRVIHHSITLYFLCLPLNCNLFEYYKNVLIIDVTNDFFKEFIHDVDYGFIYNTYIKKNVK